MQPRAFVAAAVLAVSTLALCACGANLSGAARAPAAPPTVTAVGYALAEAAPPSAAVTLHIDILVNGAGAAATWQTLSQAVAAVEAALRRAGASARAIGIAGAPSLTAQVGPLAVEASQTVVAQFASSSAALRALTRLRTDGLAGYNGYYMAASAVPALTPAAARAADARALHQARQRAASLAAAEGRRLGALLGATSAILSAPPCAPVSGCASATGALLPAPGPNQVVVAVRATYATAAGA